MRTGWTVLLLLGACGSVPEDAIDARPRPDSATGDVDANPNDIDASTSCTETQLAVCGRSAPGIECAVSNGTSAFQPLSSWSANFSDASGWQVTMNTWATIRFPDVTGDGKADVCGRASDGIQCGVSNGTGFAASTTWVTEFSDAQGWDNQPSYWATLDFPDIDGDGSDDVCARSSGGDFCAISNSVNAFDNPIQWGTEYSNTNGWAGSVYHWASIQHPDLNGDGKDDVCGLASTGLFCGLSTGTTFATQTNWSTYFNDTDGWNVDAQWMTLQFADVNGDGKDDACGRGPGGVACALSNGTSAFVTPSEWEDTFTDANGWTVESSYATIQFPDVNGDGKADLCGRRTDGVACGLSSGTAFSSPLLWSTIYSDANGWNNAARYWSTIQFPDVDSDGKADVCGRSPTGIQCARSNGTTGFSGTVNALGEFTDADAWDQDPNWTSIAFPQVTTGDCTPAAAPTPRLRLAQRGYF